MDILALWFIECLRSDQIRSVEKSSLLGLHLHVLFAWLNGKVNVAVPFKGVFRFSRSGYWWHIDRIPCFFQLEIWISVCRCLNQWNVMQKWTPQNLNSCSRHHVLDRFMNTTMECLIVTKTVISSLAACLSQPKLSFNYRKHKRCWQTAFQ